MQLKTSQNLVLWKNACLLLKCIFHAKIILSKKLPKNIISKIHFGGNMAI